MCAVSLLRFKGLVGSWS